MPSEVYLIAVLKKVCIDGINVNPVGTQILLKFFWRQQTKKLFGGGEGLTISMKGNLKMVRNLLLCVLYAFSSTCFAACETSLSAADNMMFDKRKISVDSSCEKFVINFEHKGKMPIAAGGHNVVIIKTKDRQLLRKLI